MASTKQVTTARDDDYIDHLSPEEAAQLLDQQARKFLNMSGKDFVRDYRAGKIKDPHRLAVARVAILLPLADD